MTKYVVKNTSILHNGKVHKEGSDIELTNEQAEKLQDFVEPLLNQNALASSKTKTTAKTEAKSQISKTDTNKNTASKSKNKTEVKSVKSNDGKSNEDGNNNDK